VLKRGQSKQKSGGSISDVMNDIAKQVADTGAHEHQDDHNDNSDQYQDHRVFHQSLPPLVRMAKHVASFRRPEAT
jgi:hypothetical protein